MTQPAQQLAAQILDGFNRHYTRFRECARAAKVAFEQADWAQIQRLAAERIAFYDERVAETVNVIEQDETLPFSDTAFLQALKNHYVELLIVPS
jgi:isocitrate dehydrogenase kinase/phosphatase